MPNIAGSQNAKGVFKMLIFTSVPDIRRTSFIIPSTSKFEKLTNIGIMVVCAGTIIVNRAIANKTPLPLNLKRAKP